jgi:hypothetical protein
MPLEASISTKWHNTALALGRAVVLVVFCGSAGVAAAKSGAPAFLTPDEAVVVRQAIDHMSRMNYDAAETGLTRGLPTTSPARFYFAGLAVMNRFVDLGDTNALRRAEAYWEPLTPKGAPHPHFKKTNTDLLNLYRGLTGMQLSYAASLRGQQFRSTTMALASRPLLKSLVSESEAPGERRSKYPEAQASLQLFEYYRERLLSKLPLIDNTEFDVKSYRLAAEGSPPLRDMFLASLFWIHIDQGQFAAAEAVSSEYLTRFPQNRLARQMHASGLYRWGRLEEAYRITLDLKSEYSKLPRDPGTLPLGYYRAVGNLARLAAARGMDREAEALKVEWMKAEKAGLTPWLPSVLRRDLARL